MKVFPTHPWKPWKFNRLPTGWWTDVVRRFSLHDPNAIQTVKDFLDDIAENNESIPDPVNWKSLEELRTLGLSLRDSVRLAKLGNLADVLQVVYGGPQGAEPSRLRLNQQRFIDVASDTPGYWRSKESQRKYLDFVKLQLGGQFEDLYKLTVKSIHQTGGSPNYLCWFAGY